MKNVKFVILILALVLVANGQEPFQPLATMQGRSFTAQDLPNETGRAWKELDQTIKKAAKDLLEIQIDEILIRREASRLGITKDALLKKEVVDKTADPTEAEIKAAYEKNKSGIGFVPLEEVRGPITRYLVLEKQNEVKKAFVKNLRTKTKITYPVSLEKPKLLLADHVATINDAPLLYAEFRARNALTLYEYEANVFDQVEKALRMLVDSAVFQEEARARNIPVNKLMQVEITSKMTEFTPAEQERITKALTSTLYKKYRVRYFIKEPKVFTQKVSVDDDPMLGSKTAPVTLVVFADFQCPACGSVNPILKSMVNKYAGKVRLVYRDFPLEKAHKDAFLAASAARAAHKQGKFYAYGDMLYRNQQALDRNSLIKYAEDLGLKKSKFVADMDSTETAAEIRKDIADGKRYGVAGTPSIFINGYKLRRLAVDALDKAIQRAIAKEF